MKTIKFEEPNLTEMIEKSLANNLSEEKLQEIINECCAEVIRSAIKHQFGYSGKIKEQLETFVKDTIGVDTSKLPVPEYTNLVAEGFKNALAGMEDEKIRKDAEELLSSILQSAPKEIKLSKLATMYTDEISEKFKDKLRESNNDYDDEGCLSFELEYDICETYPDTSCLSEHKTIIFQCPDIDDDSHRIILSVIVKKDKKATMPYARRDIKYSPSISDMEMKDWSKASCLHQLIYKMIHRDTKIIMDESEISEYFTIKLDEC